jgi:hypothetical protein
MAFRGSGVQVPSAPPSGQSRLQGLPRLCLHVSPLASTPALALYSLPVKQPFINVEEKIDKIVGRRIRTPDPFKSGMRLQSLAVELHRSLGHRWASNGVYRFKTHEEADEWMNRMLARSQTQKS